MCVCVFVGWKQFVLIIYGMKSHNSNDVEVIVQINIVILNNIQKYGNYYYY